MTYQEAFGEPAAPTVEALRAANVADIRDSLLLDLLKRWPERGRRKMFDAVAAATARMLEAHLSALAAARADERTRLSGTLPPFWRDDEDHT